MANETFESGMKNVFMRLKTTRFEPKEEIPDFEGFKPDVYAVRKLAAKRVMKILVKIETSDTISGEQARQSMEAFAQWSSKYPSRTAMVFIPAGCVSKARQDLPSYDEYYEF